MRPRASSAPAAGTCAIRTPPARAWRSFGYGGTTDLPITGDWDGNGTFTPGVVRNGSRWYLRNANTTGPGTIAFDYGRAVGPA